MASLFGDYQPGAISSFLASHKASGGGGDGGDDNVSSSSSSKKKQPKANKQPREKKEPVAVTAPAPPPSAAPVKSAVLFDDATRARFKPQQPLPGLAGPKRRRVGEDGE